MPGVIIEPIAGCIKWLPPKEDLVPDDPEIDDGCCNHPVVILSTVPRANKVDILIITSFGGLDLETKYPNQQSARLDHLPIAPSKAHPDNGTLLVLKDPLYELRKRSYVKTRAQYTILLASLQPYNRHGPEVFLSKKSYKALVKHIKYSEPAYLPSLDATRIKRIQPTSSTANYSIIPQRTGAEEDLAFLQQYWRTEYDRARRVEPSPQLLRAYSNTHAVRLTASANDTQPLLGGEYRPRSYGNYPVLPVSHPVHTGHGSGSSTPAGWENIRKCIKVVMWICFALLLSYGLYRGGCLIVSALPQVLDWMKKMFQSIEVTVQKLWSSLSHSIGLEG
ncbi:hypothetical protein F5B22DRAFT_603058 [Xylaria bambusicola]|uniref:uncharacterized protein n=1 Tax=Xylaria bambusicola TaxID=326684 RepID=UPI002008639D|nr:uncharacterized protein F5B22DRAFT_603058 [Xylaria bambusicola]KAI0517463.1 hypothetical protein F5B22DRAFT_603058 [Xylaria bambusicola]